MGLVDRVEKGDCLLVRLLRRGEGRGREAR